MKTSEINSRAMLILQLLLVVMMVMTVMMIGDEAVRICRTVESQL